MARGPSRGGGRRRAAAVLAAAPGSLLVAGDRQLLFDGRRLLVEDVDRPLHGDRPEATGAGVVGAVGNHRRSSVEVITIATPPIIVACTTARSALSAKNSMNTKMITALRSSTIHSGSGIIPSAPCVRSARASSRSGARRAISHRPLARRLTVARPSWRCGTSRGPGVLGVAERARLHGRPLAVDDRPRVANEFAQEASHAQGGGRSGAVSNCSRDDLRLRLGAASGGVEALEGQEDDEPEEHGEPGREDAEDSGGAVTVLEVASCGGPAANEQHRRDRDRRDGRDDKTGPEEAHVFLTCPQPSDLDMRRPRSAS